MSIPVEVDDAFVAEFEVEEDVPYRSPIRPKIVAEQLDTVLAADAVIIIAVAADATTDTTLDAPLPVLEDPDGNTMPPMSEDWNGNGFIFDTAVPGNTMHGTPAGDIFIFAGAYGVTINGYDGDDIVIAANSAVNIDAGAGSDIVDLSNVSGTVNLGSGGFDVLNVWSFDLEHMLTIRGFNPAEDTMYFYAGDVTSEVTGAGLVLSQDGAAFMTLVGVDADVLA